MTGAEFLAYVKRTFIRTDKDTEVYEATTDVINYIKEVHSFEDYKDIAYATPITTLGNYSFLLPTDADEIIGDPIYQNGTDSYPLTKLSKEEYDRQFPNQEASDVTKSKPSHYCIYQKAVYLGPVPDSVDYVYQINYTTNTSTAIVSGTTAVPFTPLNRKMLKHLTLGNLFADLGEDVEAEKHQTIGNGLLDVLVSKEDKNVKAVTLMKYRDT